MQSQNFPVGCIVIHDQCTHSGESLRFQGQCVGFTVFQPRCEPEHRASTRLAVHADITVHQSDQLFGNCQSQSGAISSARVGTVLLREGVENQGLALRFDANTRISNLESKQRRPSLGTDLPDANHDLAFFRKFHGIADEINQHLPQAYRVATHAPGDIWRNIHDQLQALPVCELGEQGDATFDHPAKIERRNFQLQLAGLDFGEVQDVIDDGQQGIAGLANGSGVVSLAVIQLRR